MVVCLTPDISVHSSVLVTRPVAYNRLVAQYPGTLFTQAVFTEHTVFAVC